MSGLLVFITIAFLTLSSPGPGVLFTVTNSINYGVRTALFGIIGLIIGGVIGALGYSKTAARYDAMTTACVMVNQAVEHGILQPEQVKELGELTGQTLKKDYESVASKFKFSEKQLGNASEGSNCSQFIVGVNAAQ